MKYTRILYTASVCLAFTSGLNAQETKEKTDQPNATEQPGHNEAAAKIVDQMATLFAQTAPIVKSGVDVASAKKAVTKLDAHLDKIRALMIKHKDLKMGKAQQAAFEKRMYKVGEQMGKESMLHILSVQKKDQEAAKILQDGFMNFLSKLDKASSDPEDNAPVKKATTPDEVADQMEAMFKQIIVIVQSGKDQPTAKAAVVKLNLLTKKLEALVEQNNDMEITPEKQKELNDRMYKVGEQMGKESMLHILKLKEKDPEASKTLQDGFMAFIAKLQGK